MLVGENYAGTEEIPALIEQRASSPEVLILPLLSEPTGRGLGMLWCMGATQRVLFFSE